MLRACVLVIIAGYADTVGYLRYGAFTEYSPSLATGLSSQTTSARILYPSPARARTRSHLHVFPLVRRSSSDGPMA